LGEWAMEFDVVRGGHGTFCEKEGFNRSINVDKKNGFLSSQNPMEHHQASAEHHRLACFAGVSNNHNHNRYSLYADM